MAGRGAERPSVSFPSLQESRYPRVSASESETPPQRAANAAAARAWPPAPASRRRRRARAAARWLRGGARRARIGRPQWVGNALGNHIGRSAAETLTGPAARAACSGCVSARFKSRRIERHSVAARATLTVRRSAAARAASASANSPARRCAASQALAALLQRGGGLGGVRYGASVPGTHHVPAHGHAHARASESRRSLQHRGRHRQRSGVKLQAEPTRRGAARRLGRYRVPYRTEYTSSQPRTRPTRQQSAAAVPTHASELSASAALRSSASAAAAQQQCSAPSRLLPWRAPSRRALRRRRRAPPGAPRVPGCRWCPPTCAAAAAALAAAAPSSPPTPPPQARAPPLQLRTVAAQLCAVLSAHPA